MFVKTIFKCFLGKTVIVDSVTESNQFQIALLALCPNITFRVFLDCVFRQDSVVVCFIMLVKLGKEL